MFNINDEVEFLVFCPKANLNLFDNQNLVMEFVIYLKSQNLSVFGSVVAVAFQITFCAKTHDNDVFSFFKNHF